MSPVRETYPILRTTARLFRMTGPWKRLLVPGVLLTSFVRLGLTLLLALLYGAAAEIILSGQEDVPARLIRLAVWYVPPLLGILSIAALGHYWTRTAVARATADLRSRTVRHLLAAPLEAGMADHSGVKTSLLVNDVQAAMDCLNRVLSRPLDGVLRGIGCFIYVLPIDWRVACAALGLSLIGLAYSFPFAYSMRKAGDRVQERWQCPPPASRICWVVSSPPVPTVWGIRCVRHSTGMWTWPGARDSAGHACPPRSQCATTRTAGWADWPS
jgi:ABC-type multidrug transport system fused ATPase/permease subunit